MLTVMVVASLLAACGGNRIIQTSDESAEYKSARALPPLKKATDPVEISPAQPTSTAAETVASTPDPQSSTPPVVVDIPSSVTTAQDAQTAVVQETVAEVEAPVTEPVSSSLPSAKGLDTSVVTQGDRAKLVIDAEFDQAWTGLTEALINSELTVFSRNKTAGRVSIGCAEIGNDNGVDVKRAGGWSIFNRRKAKAAEYCALQAISKKDTTVVSVLDRSGAEVSSDLGQLILNRIFK